MTDPVVPLYGPDSHVTVPDPDAPLGMPIYDGPVGDAHERLIPGRYRAAADDGHTGMVVVFTSASTFTSLDPA